MNGWNKGIQEKVFTYFKGRLLKLNLTYKVMDEDMMSRSVGSLRLRQTLTSY
jgi:hypothetical protein